jgi:tRNA nucleotidyltransferase (CCA-adding enzyme)
MLKSMIERSVGVIPYMEEPSGRTYLVLLQTKGHWGFPKGHSEDGEMDTAAALRELAEETGIRSCVLHPTFVHLQRYRIERGEGKKSTQKEVLLFLGKVLDPSGMIPQRGEVEQILWLPYPLARDRITYQSSKEALDAAENFLHANPREIG